MADDGMFIAKQDFFITGQTKNNPARAVLKKIIEAAMHMAANKTDLKMQRWKQGINTVVGEMMRDASIV